ncbi:MAG: peptidoglycan-binding domain-containing protein [Micavibrio sp.]
MKNATKATMLAAAAILLSSPALAEGYQQSTGADVQVPSSASNNDYIQTDETGASIHTDTMQSGTTANTGTATATSTSLAGLDSGTIEQVQESLRDEGHSVSVDGIWGPRTAEALRQFQQANGLSVTGAPDSDTLAALDVDANR